MYLSKSDYILGCFCEKALWLKKHRRDLLETPETNAQADTGYDVQDLAQKLYPDGVMIEAEPWEVGQGAELTKKQAKKHSVLFEAVAKDDDGTFCRIDILEKNGRSWNLIEIKSTNEVKDTQIQDLAYQHYVFTQAGYKIKQCFILHLNKDYVRGKRLSIKNLFKLDDVTEEVAEIQESVSKNTDYLLKYQNKRVEPKIKISKQCQKCDFYAYCCAKVPDYSIWDIFQITTATKICEKLNSYDINKLNADDYDGKNKIDIEAWQKQKIHCDKKQIKEFLSQLKYPLYYLDYETIQSAIPMFENSSPYQQIPFQFSLHIQKEVGGEVKHISFLHKEKSDPRRALAEYLVKHCGKKGSVVVYNQTFEKSRNAELADLFPDLRKALLAINDRIVDQLIPFRERALYHYKQHSSASIKHVLPAFTKLSYENMEVHNGGEAMERYLAFMQGKLTLAEEKALFDGLEAYCGQDTYAMVKLMEVLYKKAK